MGPQNAGDVPDLEYNDSGHVHEDAGKQDGPSAEEHQQAPQEEASQEELVKTTVDLLDFSDDVLLCILQYCSPMDLKALGFTCTRLSTLILDHTLWNVVDARDRSCGKMRMHWLLTHGINENTTALRLTGYAREAKGCLGYMTGSRDDNTDPAPEDLQPWNIPEQHPVPEEGPRLFRLSANALPRYGGGFPFWPSNMVQPNSGPSSGDPNVPEPTGDHCPGPQVTLTHWSLARMYYLCTSLTELTLEHVVLDCNMTTIAMFPKTLTKLSLLGTKCFNLEKSFLHKIQDRLLLLEDLDISYCEWVEPACMLPLSKLPVLSRLILQYCPKLSEFVAYASLATRYGFKTLKILDLRGSPVGDSEVSALGWLPKLEELYLECAGAAPRHADHAHFSRDPPPKHTELDPWEEQEPEIYRSKYATEQWIIDEQSGCLYKDFPPDQASLSSRCVLLTRMISEPSADRHMVDHVWDEYVRNREYANNRLALPNNGGNPNAGNQNQPNLIALIDIGNPNAANDVADPNAPFVVRNIGALIEAANARSARNNANRNARNAANDGANPNVPVDVHPNEPIDGANPNVPVNAVNPNEPNDGANPNVPVDAVNPNEPNDGANPNVPVDAVNTNEQIDGANPNVPVDAVNPNVPNDAANQNGPNDGANRNVPVDAVNQNGPIEGAKQNKPNDGVNQNEPNDGANTNAADDVAKLNAPTDDADQNASNDEVNQNAPNDDANQNASNNDANQNGSNDNADKNAPSDDANPPPADDDDSDAPNDDDDQDAPNVDGNRRPYAPVPAPRLRAMLRTLDRFAPLEEALDNLREAREANRIARNEAIANRNAHLDEIIQNPDRVPPNPVNEAARNPILNAMIDDGNVARDPDEANNEPERRPRPRVREIRNRGPTGYIISNVGYVRRTFHMYPGDDRLYEYVNGQEERIVGDGPGPGDAACADHNDIEYEGRHPLRRTPRFEVEYEEYDGDVNQYRPRRRVEELDAVELALKRRHEAEQEASTSKRTREEEEMERNRQNGEPRENANGPQENGGDMQDSGNGPQENGDGPQDSGNGPQENGDDTQDSGNGPQDIGDESQQNDQGNGWQQNGHAPHQNGFEPMQNGEPCATKASKKYFDDDNCQVSRAFIKKSLEDFKKRTENPTYRPPDRFDFDSFDGTLKDDDFDDDDDDDGKPKPKRSRGAMAVNYGASTSQQPMEIDCSGVDNSTVGNSTIDNSTMGNSTIDNSTMGNSTIDNSTMGNSTIDNSTMGNSTIDNSTVDNPKPTVDNTTVDDSTADDATVDNSMDNSTDKSGADKSAENKSSVDKPAVEDDDDCYGPPLTAEQIAEGERSDLALIAQRKLNEKLYPCCCPPPYGSRGRGAGPSTSNAGSQSMVRPLPSTSRAGRADSEPPMSNADDSPPSSAPDVRPDYEDRTVGQRYIRFRHNKSPVVVCGHHIPQNVICPNVRNPDVNNRFFRHRNIIPISAPDVLPIVQNIAPAAAGQPANGNADGNAAGNAMGNAAGNAVGNGAGNAAGNAAGNDDIARHRILYVNVSRRRHAMYQISMPEAVDMGARPNTAHMNLIYSSHLAPHVLYENLISDAAIRRFGRADGENINYVNIGPRGPVPAGPNPDPNSRPNRSNLRVLSVIGYNHITNSSLTHLATAAPHLTLVDFRGTRVTDTGVEHFRNLRPDCEVRYGPIDDGGPDRPPRPGSH